MSNASRPPSPALPPKSEPKTERCHHALCDCPAQGVRRDDHVYCSSACADPEARTLDVCPCGHGACKRAGRHPDGPHEPPAPPPPLVPPVVVL